LPKVNLTVRHRVRKGETLRKIAEEYAVSPTELARVNHLGRGRPLRRGMLLTVPSSFRAPKPEVISIDSEDPRASTDYVPSRRIGLPGKIEGNSVPIDRVTHTVRRGESLRTIAARYGVTVADLRKWNRVTTPTVKVGSRLRIRSTDAGSDSTMSSGQLPVTASPAAVAANGVEPSTAPETPQMHTVGRGETLTSIASRYQVSVADLRRWNGLAKGKAVQKGQLVQVSGDAIADASTLDREAGGPDAKRTSGNGKARAAATHTVRKGETLTSIAERHGVTVAALKKLNKLQSTNVIVGQRIKLPA
ncbi:MAG: LysM peptidoglycan-binding domain-containing protein, partial [Candidatus Eisenbacteria bacterium]|nr:LysM peptidoglycan-binding domain-containing protein [Candidatus Eisenbacteria bacterium]